VIEFLHEIHSNQGTSKMSADNLARVFAPSILCNQADKDPKTPFMPADFRRLSASISIVSTMIQAGANIFDPPKKEDRDAKEYTRFKDTLRRDGAKVSKRLEAMLNQETDAMESILPSDSSIESPRRSRESIVGSDVFLGKATGHVARARATSLRDSQAPNDDIAGTEEKQNSKRKRRMSVPAADAASTENKSKESRSKKGNLLSTAPERKNRKRRHGRGKKNRETQTSPERLGQPSHHHIVEQVTPTAVSSFHSIRLAAARKARSAPQLVGGRHALDWTTAVASKWPRTTNIRSKMRLSLPAYLDPIGEDEEIQSSTISTPDPSQ
jgi:hypothetical protein